MIESNSRNKSRIFTLPNLLSLLRLAMIPLFMWLYCIKKDYMMTAAVLIASGVTDFVDGIIARRFDMVSDFGKMLDPIADKLTQIAISFCLVSRFPLMLVLLLTIAVKEVAIGVTELIIIRKTGSVYGAEWHGKVATWLIYFTVTLHVLWAAIPYVLSVCMIATASAAVTLSLVLYAIGNAKKLKDWRK